MLRVWVQPLRPVRRRLAQNRPQAPFPAVLQEVRLTIAISRPPLPSMQRTTSSDTPSGATRLRDSGYLSSCRDGLLYRSSTPPPPFTVQRPPHDGADAPDPGTALRRIRSDSVRCGTSPTINLRLTGMTGMCALLDALRPAGPGGEGATPGRAPGGERAGDLADTSALMTAWASAARCHGPRPHHKAVRGFQRRLVKLTPRLGGIPPNSRA